MSTTTPPTPGEPERDDARTGPDPETSTGPDDGGAPTAPQAVPPPVDSPAATPSPVGTPAPAAPPAPVGAPAESTETAAGPASTDQADARPASATPGNATPGPTDTAGTTPTAPSGTTPTASSGTAPAPDPLTAPSAPPAPAAPQRDPGLGGGQHAAERPRPPSAPPAVPLPPTPPAAPGGTENAGTGTGAPAPLTGSPADRRAIADRTIVDAPAAGGPASGPGSPAAGNRQTSGSGDTAVGATAVVPPLGAPGSTGSTAPGTPGSTPPGTPGTPPPGAGTPAADATPPAVLQTRRPLPEPPRRPGFGRHLLGVLVGLVATPVALVLTGLGAARIADVVGGTEPTDVLAIVLLALGAALLAVVVLLGAWSPAVPITAGAVWGLGLGATYLAIPRTVDDAVVSIVGDQFTPEALDQLTWFAASGVLLVTGALLVAAGLATGFARRAGRRWAELVTAADVARSRGTGPS